MGRLSMMENTLNDDSSKSLPSQRISYGYEQSGIITESKKLSPERLNKSVMNFPASF
jgi:hypothetical protein